MPISAAEFSNVVGRSGRAFVDLDGISVLPTFDAGTRSQQHALFETLSGIPRHGGETFNPGLTQIYVFVWSNWLGLLATNVLI